MDNRIAFLAYNITRRSKVLAEHLHAKIIACKINNHRVIRLFNYPLLIFLTFLNLVHKKFDTVFVQLPPIHTAIPAYLYCKLFRKQLIFDTHSGIFFIQGLHQKIYYKLYCSMIRNVSLNIVHNDDILNRACLKNSASIVLEDKISFTPTEFTKSTPLAVAVICGYGKDEPIQAIVETVQKLSDIQFFLTGDKRKLQVRQLPKNINLTGFLPDIEYEQLLNKVDMIMVLTKRLDTVLCGAYEAVGLTKPLITSDTATLRKYFYKGTVHTANNVSSIIQAIQTAQPQLEKLQQEMTELRKEKITTWQKQFEPINNILKNEHESH